MKVEQKVVANVAVFRVSGVHTTRDAGTLQAKVDRALQRGFRNVVLDLEGVTQMGAAGLGELVNVYGAVRRLKGAAEAVGGARSRPLPPGSRGPRTFLRDSGFGAESHRGRDVPNQRSSGLVLEVPQRTARANPLSGRLVRGHCVTVPIID